MGVSAKQAITAKLRAFHKVGLEVLSTERKKITEGASRYNRIDGILKKLPHSQSYLFCARKFATLYPAGERLDWICGLGRSRSKAQSTGQPLGPSHVMQLLSVKNKADRDRLATKCANEGWSVIRLRRELAKRRSKQPGSGRQFHVAPNPELAIVELQFMAERWDRWISASKATQSNDKSSVYGCFPTRVRKALSAIQENLATLIPAPAAPPDSQPKSSSPRSVRGGKLASAPERDRGRATSKRA